MKKFALAALFSVAAFGQTQNQVYVGSPGGTAGGDLCGTYPNPCVMEITENKTAGAGGVLANTFVKLDATTPGVVDELATTDLTWYGVALNTASQGQSVQVRRFGPAQVLVSGPYTLNDAAIVSTATAGYAMDSGTTRNGVSILSSVALFQGTCMTSCAGTLATIIIVASDRGALVTTSVGVNGSEVSNPNFNATTPGADAGYLALALKFLANNIIVEAPVSGNGTKLATTTMLSDPGAGTPTCTDGNGNIVPTGCPSGGIVALYGGSGGTPGMAFSTVERCLPVTFSYTAFTATTSNQLITVFNVPANWRATRFELRENTTFACSGSCTQITSMTAQLYGASGAAALTAPFPLMGASSPPFQTFDGGGFSAASTWNGTDTLALQLRVTNSNPGNLGNGTTTNLTAGTLVVLACGVVNGG